MTIHCSRRVFLLISTIVLLATAQARQTDPSHIRVPEGYKIEVVAQGLDQLVDLSFGPGGELYAALAGGHGYGATPGQAPPARIVQVMPDGSIKDIVGAGHQLSLEQIRQAKPSKYVDLEGEKVPAAYALPEGIIMPITGVTYYKGKLYISHRTRISSYDLATGRFKTVVDELPSWGEFLNTKPIFRDGKMYFTQATQGDLGSLGSLFMQTSAMFNKPLAREVPCDHVILTGVDFWVDNGFTDDDVRDAKLSGVYVPFGFTTRYGQALKAQLKCNGAFYRANPDGTELEVIASGLRSNAGYDFSPSGRLVATQNACNPAAPRQIHDDYETIYEVREGTWYGWPEFCSSIPVTDPRFILPNNEDFQKEFDQESPLHHSFVLTGATRTRLLNGRNAPPLPLARMTPYARAEGIKFGRWEFGLDPENEVLVALMGNLIPVTGNKRPGFKVIKVNLDTGEARDFIVNKVAGPASATGNKGMERPVQIAWGPDGALYVADMGIIHLTREGMHAQPDSGVIWKLSQK